MRTATVIMMVAVIGLIAACNTLNGIGKDVEWAGEKLQGATR